MMATFETAIALVLLVVLLAGSFLIGLRSRSRIKDANSFLFADNMQWYDFALNTIGTNISVSGGIILTIAYTYIYGWKFSAGIILSYALGLVAYNWFIGKSDRVAQFFNAKKGSSLVSFVVSNYEEGVGARAIQGIAAGAIVLSYWATFSAELLALEKILSPFWKGDETLLVLAGGLMCVFYTMLGGYRSVYLTDGLQTGILGLSAVWLSIIIVSSNHFPIEKLLLSRPVPEAEMWYGIMLFIIMGVAFQVTAMDMWVRTQASNASHTLKEPRLGIWVSLLGVIFFLAIMVIGLSAYATSADWGSNLDQILPKFLLYLTSQGLSGTLLISVLLVLLFSVALSTADTTLITAAQTVYQDLLPSVAPKASLGLFHSRLIVAILGLTGIAFAFVLPGVIEGAFLFAGSQLILIPLLIGAVLGRFRNPAAGIVSTALGTLTLLALIMFGGREASAIAPAAAIIVSAILFFPLNIFATGKVKAN